MKKGKIYLIPTPIGDTAVYDVMPAVNQGVIQAIDYFVVENLRSARRFLSAAGVGKPIDSLTFVELSEHTQSSDLDMIIKPVLDGADAGIISEAGLPAIADPGADLVALAHRLGVEVVPLVGPSSIIMALMASGMNGQSFAFNGYLPVKQPDRSKAIKHFERRAMTENQSQIFIEAPYRNQKLYEDFLSSCAAETLLTVATDISQPNAYIKTKRISDWKKQTPPDINKRPTVFVMM